jgi:signal transduction histidine kinase
VAKKFSGAGLGLDIVRKLVEAYGGIVEVRSPQCGRRRTGLQVELAYQIVCGRLNKSTPLIVETLEPCGTRLLESRQKSSKHGAQFLISFS